MIFASVCLVHTHSAVSLAADIYGINIYAQSELTFIIYIANCIDMLVRCLFRYLHCNADSVQSANAALYSYVRSRRRRHVIGAYVCCAQWNIYVRAFIVPLRRASSCPVSVHLWQYRYACFVSFWYCLTLIAILI